MPFLELPDPEKTVMWWWWVFHFAYFGTTKKALEPPLAPPPYNHTTTAMTTPRKSETTISACSLRLPAPTAAMFCIGLDTMTKRQPGVLFRGRPVSFLNNAAPLRFFSYRRPSLINGR